MQNYKTRKELKYDTKALLKGRWKDAILLNIIPTIISILITLLFAALVIALVNYSDVGSNYWANNSMMSDDGTGNGTSNIGSGILSTLFTVGISFTFLDWFRNPNMEIQPIRMGLQVFTKKYFLRVLLIYIISTIFTTLWTLLFIVPGIIKSYAYSQAYLIYKDRSNLSPNEKISSLDCITESKNLMKGHKWRLFVLDLSFIGWGILSVLSLGIGLLWLLPYQNATKVAFYEDLIQSN
ncbi:MAG: DUF975 family protein [Carnobacterium sp.]|uniref:DUF975 family protein n=1 Tax=Carnobacterium sp. TaxID=48221 RepID=UPI00331567B1